MFWIDLEMTGLDENKDRIIEVAVVLTDLDFNKVDEYHKIVYQPKEILDGMDEWCIKHHGESGLTDAVKNGSKLEDVEKELIDLINDHYGKKEDKVVIIGNSIHNDRRFIDRYLKEFAKKLHYRMIDVSSFKEVFKMKYNVIFNKNNTHRALDDIYESIRELKYYLNNVKI